MLVINPVFAIHSKYQAIVLEAAVYYLSVNWRKGAQEFYNISVTLASWVATESICGACVLSRLVWS